MQSLKFLPSLLFKICIKIGPFSLFPRVIIWAVWVCSY